jgi:hypothetical protein
MIPFPWQKKKKKRSANTQFTTGIVPVLPFFPGKEKKIAEILKWLVEIKAVKPELSECTWHLNSPGYAIDKGAKKLSKQPRALPFGQERCGLEIIRKPTLFDGGDKGMFFVACPVCKKAPNIFSLSEAYLQQHRSTLKCLECECDIEINEFIYDPPCVFSDLGFVFWEWENLKEDFVKEFEKRLGCSVKVIECIIEDVDVS